MNRQYYSKKAFQRKPKAMESRSEKKISSFYGENVFNLNNVDDLSPEQKKKIAGATRGKTNLDEELAQAYADSVMNWAMEKGATHFCHWFHPLTGSTAEKHDAFLTLKNDQPIEKLSAKQLINGEPDASSFPNGGFRQTFEARGYTTWDLSSDIFVRESGHGKVLYIPTGFVSYFGNALDIKTPLLRSIDALSSSLTKFCNLTGNTLIEEVFVTAGAEQEYFLVDKAMYFAREDLVMTGRALIGDLPPKNQQLDDHYFGTISERVLSFMNDFEDELYRLGIPAKTRHNEVAPGQFEIASIFKDANTSSDNNHLLMTVLKAKAMEHDFVCLLHEKPFAGINGSGKHINWSLADNNGNNLLEPSEEPHKNFQFLAITAMVIQAIHDHAEILRMSIASHSNDHRLGANEAPPSIMSVFLGSTLDRVFRDFASGEMSNEVILKELNLGANQLASITQDNTDRNRTSPFAFTGNKFEFRAVGSSASIGLPLTILNGAVSNVVEKMNLLIIKKKEEGMDGQSILLEIIQNCFNESERTVFNGDGYSGNWVDEAERRGLSNLRTTADTLNEVRDIKYTEFLKELGILSETEIETYFNVFVERYNIHREIELKTLKNMIFQKIIPAALRYKKDLCETMKFSKEMKQDYKFEGELVKELNHLIKDITSAIGLINSSLKSYENLNPFDLSLKIAHELMPLSENVADACNKIESILPDHYWELPRLSELLFIR